MKRRRRGAGGTVPWLCTSTDQRGKKKKTEMGEGGYVWWGKNKKKGREGGYVGGGKKKEIKNKK